MYFLSYTHDTMAAEDMVQDLFVKLLNFTAVETVTIGTAKNLIFVMAKRMIVDDARHKAFVREAERDLLLRQSFYTSSTAQRIEASNILSLVSHRLETLAPKRSHIYKLNKIDGMTSDEIATALRLSKRTVETHIYLSTKEIKQYLQKIV